MSSLALFVDATFFFRIDSAAKSRYTSAMSMRSAQSLLGVLLGFLLVLPLLKREKKQPLQNAEFLLQQAQQQMREAQAKNRARAVEAITQKNNLQALADLMQKRIDRLTERAETADSEDDRQDLLRERDKTQKSFSELQASLATAIQAAEAVKIAMRREEEHIRTRTAEALTLRAEEKQAQIEIELAKSRLALTTNFATDLFVQARAKIQQTKAQRDLMLRVAQTVEILSVAIQDAEAAGNDALYQKMMASRNAIRDSALNTALWKESSGS